MGIYLDFIYLHYICTLLKGGRGELLIEISTENIYVQVCSLQHHNFNSTITKIEMSIYVEIEI